MRPRVLLVFLLTAAAVVQLAQAFTFYSITWDSQDSVPIPIETETPIIGFLDCFDDYDERDEHIEKKVSGCNVDGVTMTITVDSGPGRVANSSGVLQPGKRKTPEPLVPKKAVRQPNKAVRRPNKAVRQPTKAVKQPAKAVKQPTRKALDCDAKGQCSAQVVTGDDGGFVFYIYSNTTGGSAISAAASTVDVSSTFNARFDEPTYGIQTEPIGRLDVAVSPRPKLPSGLSASSHDMVHH
jgi:hypothetical protein